MNNSSIRRVLITNILGCVAIIIAAIVIVSYFIGRSDVDSLIDQQLVHSSMVFNALLSPNAPEKELERIQKKMLAISSKKLQTLTDHQAHGLASQNLFKEFHIQYQLWSASGKLLLHSRNIPLQPLSSAKAGFTNTYINNHSWRVYTSVSKTTGNVLIVAAHHSISSLLKQSIITDDIYILMIFFPTLGILVWVVLTHTLKPLEKISYELAHRDPNFLEPVDLTAVPVELSGLVDELNKLLLRLKQTLEREQRFASDAAHELRTPLAALRTQTQVALRSTNDPKIIKILNKVMAAAKRSTHVVGQLLILSRIIPGAALGNQNNIDLLAITQEIISELYPIAAEKNIELSLECEYEHVTLHANDVTLGILLRNLIDNAIRYSPENTSVETHIEKHQNNVVLRIIDYGPGIPKKLQSRVFERFFRVLGTNAQGSGLGLAIVQQISELHGATIKLSNSTEHSGLTIEIIFPNNIFAKLGQQHVYQS